MKLALPYFILLLLPFTINGQSVNRIEVNGIILSKTNDVEAVTVFNKSSNRGVITNEKGEFKIRVAEHDIIEISALQFQTVTLTIDVDVIKTKELKIQLVEQVNQLDAVMLSFGLTGNIETDISNVKMIKIKPIELGNMDAFSMSEDKIFDNSVIQDHLTATINPDALNYLPDLVKIFDLFKSKNKPRKPKSDNLLADSELSKGLLNVYTQKDISEAFNIPINKVEAFVSYVENKGIKPELLEPKNEMQLIEFLIKQNEIFLKLNHAKN